MRLILAFFLLFTSQFLQAQTLNGSVEDTDNQPLPGVVVFNISSNIYTETDAKGQFTIRNTKKGDSLSFSLISFEKIIKCYQSATDLHVVLEPKNFNLVEITIKKSINALQILSDINVESSPVNSSQDLLRAVPGIFIGQHAGGGKAEQIFLRGFDIDHGTDIHISVDGLPVNMVSHAHGQGYADLHFVIPETVENVAFSKGSYNADQGNFATAGSVDFKIKEKIDENIFKVDYGQFNQKRLLAMLNLLNKSSKNTAFIASEYLRADGPFEASQNLGRLNILGKASLYAATDQKVTLSASYFNSTWDASGQIPTRAVQSGLISRFGAIDNTEGGATKRINASAVFDKSITKNTFLKSTLYFTQYDFNLFSNFTFFAKNPVVGDQINQRENRNLYGFETLVSNSTHFRNIEIKNTAQIGLRADYIRNSQLARTQNKERLIENINFGNIKEKNSFVQFNSEIKNNNWLFVPGIRIDNFSFAYTNFLLPSEKKLQKSTIFASPKLNIIYQKTANAQYYTKAGFGYHSNDARVIISQKSNYQVPRSLGADVGQIHKINKTILSSALWYLALQQEFVFVGDEGIVESAGKTRRLGLDLSIRQQANSFLFFDADFTYAHARSLSEPKGENYIPLAPIVTFTFGASMAQYKGFTAGIKTRILGKRPANNDYSLTAKGYTVSDFNVGYTKSRYSLGCVIQNIFNAAWNETQFATSSRLQNEPEAINEIHFTPGTPFNLRTVLKITF
jgi:TonB-dependent Receptor Plug Domain/CarboxypepD_reg-like domain